MSIYIHPSQLSVQELKQIVSRCEVARKAGEKRPKDLQNKIRQALLDCQLIINHETGELTLHPDLEEAIHTQTHH